MERSEVNKKFIERNKSIIIELDKKVEDPDIVAIIVSIEMSNYLRFFPEGCLISNDELYKYQNKRVIVDAYCPVDSIRFIRKSESIKFDVPCVCGYFNNEEHGNRFR